jgi:hypothetical protein
MVSAAGILGLLTFSQGCAALGARNPTFGADTAPAPVMHFDPAVCLSEGTAMDGPAEHNAQLVEARLHAEIPVKGVPLAPDARAFICERLASDKAFFQWRAVGRDWTLRPVPRVFIHELATRNGAATMLLPIVRSPPCWFRHYCAENRDSIYVGLFLISADGIVLYEAEAEIDASASVLKVDSVMDKLLTGVPASYVAARNDVPPFSLVVLPPGTMDQDKAEVQELEKRPPL